MLKETFRITPINKARNIFLAAVVGSTLSISSCAEGEKKIEDQISQEETKTTALFEIEGEVFSIPSPIQTALLLKEAGVDFDKDILNPTSSVSKYTASSKKALNLGIYGADLGYVTIFEEPQSSIAYLAVSKTLAGDLGIANIFNEDLLARYEKNISNKDSLLVLVAEAFRATDQFLRENQQDDLGALILAGGWIETLHLTTNTANIKDNTTIKNRIGEQKITIENLIKLLLTLKENNDVIKLIASLNELREIFNQVEYKYEFKAPTTDPETKTTIINSVSSTEMSKETLELITQKVSSIRNTIIQ